MTRGDIFRISAPSGSGKTTICRALLSRVEGLSLSVSCTTRERKPGERDGVDYYFVDEEKFGNMLESNEFLETASVFGRRYGTSRLAVAASVLAGRDSRKEIERRLAAARREIRELGKYDYLVVNDDLETAVRQVEWIVRARRLRRERTIDAVGRILGKEGEERDGSSN